jgi:predicted dehydrogenase
MKAGKHVLTEKLMAHNIAQCKVMSRFSQDQNLLLATGHQRHYSVLYDNAVNLIRWGLLGQLHHIRAQWHRGNLPGADSWAPPLPGGFDVGGKKIDPIKSRVNSLRAALAKEKNAEAYANLEMQLAQWEALDQDKDIRPEEFGYETVTLSDGRVRSAMEELIRWRLWDRTGGGLMAELGSHQLDAATIFISALRNDGKKARPLSVHAVGGRHMFPYDRDADDHVYCMFEFPGPAYEFPENDNLKPEEIIKKQVGYYDAMNSYPTLEKGIPPYETDPNKKIVVTYSSINGNGFGGYGEVVMGSKGTLVLDREQEVMLYRNAETTTNVTVRQTSGGPTMDTTDSGAPTATAAAGGAVGKVSRGYREEMEHWAWCIRNRAPENKPRCHPEVAMGDAIIALTAKVAIANSNRGKSGYIEFKPEWFDIESDETPDGSSIESERVKLKV